MRLLFIDTETTGLHPDKGHRICEIAAIEYIDNKPTGLQFHTYLNPERELDPGAAKVNGLSLDKLKNKPLFKDIASRFFDFLIDDYCENMQSYRTKLIAHNAKFDMSFLKKELNDFSKFRMLGAASFLDRRIDEECEIICTKEYVNKLYPGDPTSLDALCKRFDIDNSHRGTHGALIDAKLLAEVYFRLKGCETRLIG
jgi:DNA polymerase III subunit epsilon